jgi:hypothetical protein
MKISGEKMKRSYNSISYGMISSYIRGNQKIRLQTHEMWESPKLLFEGPAIDAGICGTQRALYDTIESMKIAELSAAGDTLIIGIRCHVEE